MECSAWAALRRGPCAIIGDYPEQYRAVSRQLPALASSAHTGQSERMNGEVDQTVVRRYVALIESFLGEQRTTEQFVSDFLDEWKRDRNSGIRTGDEIDNLMTGVDCYSDTLIDVWAIDEDQLRREATDALAAISG